MATHSAQTIAAEIRRRLPGVPTKKLHKLLYYAQAHHAATFDAPLFAETISAWDMGPVVAQLWWQENQHGTATGASIAPLGEAELNTIGYVLSRYGKLSGSELERLTHSEQPWIDADAQRQQLGAKTHKITVDVLAAYFKEQAAQDESAVPVDQSALDLWFAQSGTVGETATPDTPNDLLARIR